MEIMQQETRLSVRVLSSSSYLLYPEVLCRQYEYVSFKDTWRVSKGFIFLEIKYTGFWSENLKWKEHLGNLCIEGRLVLK
jgi:hypothetical protein